MKRVLDLLLLVPALALALLMRLVRPWRLIRVGGFNTSRIGHFAADAEFYLCERDAGMQSKSLDLFHPQKMVANQALLRMFKRKINITPLARRLDRANQMLPGARRHQIRIKGRDEHKSRDVDLLLMRSPVHLEFSRSEKARGAKELERMGIGPDQPFVCIFGRDPAYLDSLHPQIDWSYHDYRDMAINDFADCANALAHKDLFVLRLGSKVKEGLKTASPRIIDYACNGSRSEFMDVYLSAKCQFFMGAPGGITALPMIFRIPCAYVNFIPLEFVQAWNARDLFIPKKLWSVENKRLLTFSEILDSGLGRLTKTENFKAKGIEVINNTPEEIRELGLEMLARTTNQWNATKEDEELQQKFWRKFKPSELNQKFLCRIGTHFLRTNQELL